MSVYLVLIRGINVGGNNKVSMAELRSSLEEAGFTTVSTFINSGNVILESDLTAKKTQLKIEKLLQENFSLSAENKVLVLTPQELNAVIENKPRGFGNDPDKYYSDAIFLLDITSKEAFAIFDPREGVDKIWPGKNVIYSQRLGSERTKSRLSKIIASPLYKSMTIRSWNTTMKLQELVSERNTTK